MALSPVSQPGMATVTGYTAGPQTGDTAALALLQMQAEQRLNPDMAGRDRSMVVPSGAGMPVAQPGMAAPPIGLIGSEQALMGGSSAAIDALLGGFNQARGALQPVSVDMGNVSSSIAQGVQGASGSIAQGISGSGAVLQPWQRPGLQAFDLQAALSGALGPQAQAQAYSTFQSSPGQQFLRDRAEQALLRNSAALGGLGGGRVRQELQRQAIGEAQQDFGNAFNRIGTVAQGGLAAAGQEAGLIGQLRGQEAAAIAQLRGQEASIAGNLEGQRMGLTSQQQRDLAQIAATTGTNAANIAAQTGQQVARDRFTTGTNLAGAIGGTTSALATLVNQQGQDLAGTIAAGAGDLSNVIAGAGGGQAQSQQNLAALLANIISGQGSQVGSLPGVPGTQQTTGVLGNVGNFLSGVGSLIPRPGG